MKLATSGISILSAIFLLIGDSAFSQELRGSFTGTVTSEYGDVPAPLSIGDDLIFDFFYDPSLIDLDNSFTLNSSANFTFQGDGASINISSGGFSYQASDNVSINVTNNQNLGTTGQTFDSFILSSQRQTFSEDGSLFRSEDFFAVFEEYPPQDEHSNLLENLNLPNADFFSSVSDFEGNLNMVNFGQLNLTTEDNVEVGVEFDIDLNSFSLEGVQSESPDAVVFLDFDGGVNGGFVEIPVVGVDKLVPLTILGGSHPAGAYEQSARDIIEDTIEQAYLDSGVNIEVVQTEPTDGDFVTIEFGVDLSGRNGIGIAYDVGTTLNPFTPDRFDRRKDGTAAVFANLNLIDDPGDLALAAEIVGEISAHELTHAFGGSHIDPNHLDDDLNFEALLDYRVQNGDQPRLFDQPTPIVTVFPDNGSPVFGDVTHNPEYHVRRYVSGTPEEELRAEGLVPGSYDTTGFNLSTIELLLLESLAEVDQWYLGTGVFSAVAGEPQVMFGLDSLLFDLSAFAEQDSLVFQMVDQGSFSLHGRTADSAAINVFAGKSSDPSMREFTLESFLTDDISLFRNDDPSGVLFEISSLSAMLVSTETISPQSAVSSVPLPSSLIFFLSALISLALFRSKRRKIIATQ